MLELLNLWVKTSSAAIQMKAIAVLFHGAVHFDVPGSYNFLVHGQKPQIWHFT